MKLLFLPFQILASVLFSPLCPVNPDESSGVPAETAPPVAATGKHRREADTDLTLFGRGLYPGNDSSYKMIGESGFTTIILSSFYIHADGDVYSGDDHRNPIIHDGRYTGNKEWPARIASLRQQPGGVRRIEILLEGRWFNQPPNTYDFIKDWSDPDKNFPGVVTGTGKKSTLYQIARVFKKDLGVDAVCIDDESVYDSPSIVSFGKILGKWNLHMTLCPFTNSVYWKQILSGSKKKLVDAVYIQCYDGGKHNEPGQWADSLGTTLPVYPIFLCRGAFGKCSSTHNSKSPAEIGSDMARFRQGYPDLSGGAVWQMADIKSYIRMNCAVRDTASGDAVTAAQYLDELKNKLKQGL